MQGESRLHIVFRIVDTQEIGRAHVWHSEFAAANDAIFPRTEAKFFELAMARCLWCAVSSDDHYLAMSYANFDDGAWEIGGLMVDPEMRGKGVGTIMMRLPLAHLLFTEQPLSWTPRPPILTHVLKGNEAPRRIIPEVGFEFEKPVRVPPSAVPGLKVEADGWVHGDEFHLATPEALLRLADWAGSWTGRLRDGTSAEIDLLDGTTMNDWSAAFRDMAASV